MHEKVLREPESLFLSQREATDCWILWVLGSLKPEVVESMGLTAEQCKDQEWLKEFLVEWLEKHG